MRAVEANHGIPSLGSSNPSFLEGGRGRKKEKSEGVSGMVLELRVGIVHFGLHGAGGVTGLSHRRLALALADGGAGFGWDRDSCGGFMDQKIYRQAVQSA